MVRQGKPDDCWPWLGNVNQDGYGRLHLHGKKAAVPHRFAYALLHGPIPRGLECCHSCDNPRCCNPAHLFLGTHKQNMEDMVKKGRQAFLKGELHGEAKLNEKQVLEIRKMHEAGKSQYRLASIFNVSKRLIWNIVHRKSWVHI